jgi:hypothetical protein
MQRATRLQAGQQVPPTEDALRQSYGAIAERMQSATRLQAGQQLPPTEKALRKSHGAIAESMQRAVRLQAGQQLPPTERALLYSYGAIAERMQSATRLQAGQQLQPTASQLRARAYWDGVRQRTAAGFAAAEAAMRMQDWTVNAPLVVNMSPQALVNHHRARMQAEIRWLQQRIGTTPTAQLQLAAPTAQPQLAGYSGYGLPSRALQKTHHVAWWGESWCGMLFDASMFHTSPAAVPPRKSKFVGPCVVLLTLFGQRRDQNGRIVMASLLSSSGHSHYWPDALLRAGTFEDLVTKLIEQQLVPRGVLVQLRVDRQAPGMGLGFSYALRAADVVHDAYERIDQLHSLGVSPTDPRFVAAEREATQLQLVYGCYTMIGQPRQIGDRSRVWVARHDVQVPNRAGTALVTVPAFTVPDNMSVDMASHLFELDRVVNDISTAVQATVAEEP